MNQPSLVGIWKRGLLAARQALLLTLLLALLFGPSSARQHVSAGRPLPLNLDKPVTSTTGMADGSAEWGDYDNDGDLDLLGTGIGNDEIPKTIIFENNTAGTAISLAEINSGSSGLPNVELSSAVWGDTNHDGYLDVLITGMTNFHSGLVLATSAVYRNIPDPNDPNNPNPRRVFTNSNAGLQPVYRGEAVWGDYDNDGHPDILLTGYIPDTLPNMPPQPTPFAQIYHNNGDGTFSSLNLSLTGAGDSAAAWADFDGDGLLDFAYSGLNAGKVAITRLYHNNGGGSFTDVSALLPGLSGLHSGTINWVDVNMDGRLDLFLTGNAQPNPLATALPVTLLYLNTRQGFSLLKNSTTGLIGFWNSSSDWADYDNDGDPDLLISGNTSGYAFTNIFINDLKGSGKFLVDTSANLTEGYRVSVAWGDVNNQRAGDALSAGTPDVLLTGATINNWYVTSLYRNAPTVVNNPPATPTGLAACWDRASGITFRGTASDDHTPPAALSYNLRLGTTPSGAEIVLPSASQSGLNRLAAPGLGRPALLVSNLVQGKTYFWSMQAIDGALAGGPFSNEKSFAFGAQIAKDDSATLDEDTPTAIDVLANDASANGAVTIQSVDAPAHGTTAISAGKVLYSPALNYNGTDAFNYYAVDPTGYCVVGHVAVQVNPVNNDPPSLAWKDAQGNLQSTFPVTVQVIVTNNRLPFQLTLVGSDPDAGDSFTWSIATPAAHGLASVPASTSDGQENPLSYTPQPGYLGSDSFVVKITDSDLSPNSTQVTVNVQVMANLFFPLVGR